MTEKKRTEGLVVATQRGKLLFTRECGHVTTTPRVALVVAFVIGSILGTVYNFVITTLF